MYKGSVKFPNIFWGIADEIANARLIVNKEMNKSVKDSYGGYNRFDRGEKNHKVDLYGIIGELIARYWLDCEGRDYIGAKLIEEKPQKVADIVLDDENGVRLDVKCSDIKFWSLLINKEAHLKGKNEIDFYWYIKVDESTNIAYQYLIKYDDVSKWSSRVFKYTEAYYFDVKNRKDEKENSH